MILRFRLSLVLTWSTVYLLTHFSIWVGSVGASATTSVRVQQLIAGNGTRDYFGYAVSTSGNALAVGAWKHDLKGAAFVFHRESNGSWTLAQRLLAPIRTKNDQFGCAVSLLGDSLAIGANRDDERGTDSGAVYVFHRAQSSNTWFMEQKLTMVTINSTENSRFGTSVAFSEDSKVLAVGAYRDSFSGQEAGSVYVFQYAPEGRFSFEQRISSADSAKGDRFGWAVSMSGNHIAIGAPRNGPDGPASGAVYVFQQRNVAGSWDLLQKIIAPDGKMTDNQFGISVVLWQDILTIGSHMDSHNGLSVGAGSVYVFRFGVGVGMRFSMVQKLMAVDSGPQDRYGISVAVRGSKLAVGAYLDDEGGTDTGSAYLYQENNKGHWLLERKFTGSGSTWDSNFGRSVAIPDNDDILVVGASGRDPSTYVFGPLPEPPTTTPRPHCEFGKGYCQVCVSDPQGKTERVCFHGFGWGLCADEAGEPLQYRARLNVTSHKECAQYAASEPLSTGFVHVEGWGGFDHECRIYGPALSGLQAPEWKLHAANGSIISKSVPVTGDDAEGYRKWLCFRRDHLTAKSCTITRTSGDGLHSIPCKGGSEIAHGAACIPQCAALKETPSTKTLRCYNGTLYPSASGLHCTGSSAASPAPRSWWYSFLSPRPNVAGAWVYHVFEATILIMLPKIALFSEDSNANATALLFSEKVRGLVGNATSALLGLPEQALEVLQYVAVPGRPQGSLRVEVRVVPPMPVPDEKSFRSFAAKFKTRFKSPYWDEGQYRGATVLMTGFAELGLVLLGSTSALFSTVAEPEAILCDESQVTGNDMGYYKYVGCQTRTMSGRTCERWSDHPEVLQENAWQIDRDGAHSNCRNPDGRETGRPLVGGPNPQASTGSKHIWCLARDAPGATLFPEFCMPLAFRAPVLCKAPLMAMVELGGETMPFVVTTQDWSGKNQEWMAPGDVEWRENGCYQLNPDFKGAMAVRCSDQGELHADVSKCEDTVFNVTSGSVGTTGLTQALEGLTVGACRRRCLELQGECQGFEFAQRQIQSDEGSEVTFSIGKGQDNKKEKMFCTLHASISEIRPASPEENSWVYRLVGTPAHWPQVHSEIRQVSPEEDSDAGPLPTILGVVAAVMFSCVVLWVLRRHCDLSSLLEEPEPAKPIQVNPEKPLKCSYCGRGFNTYPALTVHERRCEAAAQEAERIRKESQKSSVARLRGWLGISGPVRKQVLTPTLVQVGSP